MLSPVPAEGLEVPLSTDTGSYLSKPGRTTCSYCPAEAQLIRIAAHMRIAPASPSVIVMAGESGHMFTNRSYVYKYRPSQNHPRIQSQWR